MSGAIPPLPHYAFNAWCLVKPRDNFTFTLPSVIGGRFFHVQPKDAPYRCDRGRTWRSNTIVSTMKMADLTVDFEYSWNKKHISHIRFSLWFQYSLGHSRYFIIKDILNGTVVPCPFTLPTIHNNQSILYDAI
jgi:hypothetical protein